MLEQAYHDALARSGAEFLEAEQRLVQAGAGADAGSVLRSRADAETGVDGLVARALLARTDPDAAVSRALSDLHAMAADAARTAMGAPSPLYVRGYLKKHFGAEAAPHLAAYVLKLWPVWPGWMTAGVAMYAGEEGGPQVGDALVALALSVADPYQREVAARALVRSGDAGVHEKLDAAVARAPETLRDEVRAAAEDVRGRIDAQG